MMVDIGGSKIISGDVGRNKWNRIGVIKKLVVVIGNDKSLSVSSDLLRQW